MYQCRYTENWQHRHWHTDTDHTDILTTPTPTSPKTMTHWPYWYQ